MGSYQQPKKIANRLHLDFTTFASTCDPSSQNQKLLKHCLHDKLTSLFSHNQLLWNRESNMLVISNEHNWLFSIRSTSSSLNGENISANREFWPQDDVTTSSIEGILGKETSVKPSFFTRIPWGNSETRTVWLPKTWMSKSSGYRLMPSVR